MVQWSLESMHAYLLHMHGGYRWSLQMVELSLFLSTLINALTKSIAVLVVWSETLHPNIRSVVWLKLYL